MGKYIIQIAVSNIICSVVFSKRWVLGLGKSIFFPITVEGVWAVNSSMNLLKHEECEYLNNSCHQYWSISLYQFYRYDYDDKHFNLYMEIMNKNFEFVGNSGILNVFPWLIHLKHLPGQYHICHSKFRLDNFDIIRCRQFD